MIISARPGNARGIARVTVQFNTWPEVHIIVASPNGRVATNGTINLDLNASDPDGDALTYVWTDDCGGSFSNSSAQDPVWTAPSTAPVSGRCSLTVQVNDGRGGSNNGSLTVQVGDPVQAGLAPVLTTTFQSTETAISGGSVLFRVIAEDPEGTALTFAWSDDNGAINSGITNTGTSPYTSELLWVKPSGGCSNTVSVVVSDTNGQSTNYSFTVQCSSVSTVAGNGTSGDTTTAPYLLNGIHNLAAAPNGDIYFTDLNNHKVKKWSSTGVVSVVAANTSGTTPLHSPHGIARDANGDFYVSDAVHHKIFKLYVGTTCPSGCLGATGNLQEIVGNTQGFQDGTNALLNTPHMLTVDNNGVIFVSDRANNRVRRIAYMTNGTCLGTPNYTGYCTTTVIGSTSGFQDGTSALINHPSGIAVAPNGDIYLSDLNNNRIRKITYMTNGTCLGTPNYTGYCTTTFAGDGTPGHVNGIGIAARFDAPTGLHYGNDGYLYVSDSNNHRIRMIASDATVTTIAGSGAASYADGVAENATFNFPIGITLGADGLLYVADFQNNALRQITR